MLHAEVVTRFSVWISRLKLKSSERPQLDLINVVRGRGAACQKLRINVGK